MYVRWAITLLVWLVAVAVLAPVCFFVVLLLAGPHSSMLPSVLQPVVLILGWVAFLAGPVWIAHRVWRWLSSRPQREADV